MRSNRRRWAFGVAAAAVLAAGLGMSVSGAPPAEATPQFPFFKDRSTALDPVTVSGCRSSEVKLSARVTHVRIEAVGGAGGDSRFDYLGADVTRPGGRGARVTAEIPVEAGETLRVFGGCRGTDGIMESDRRTTGRGHDWSALPGNGGSAGDGGSGAGGGGTAGSVWSMTRESSLVVAGGGGGAGGMGWAGLVVYSGGRGGDGGLNPGDGATGSGISGTSGGRGGDGGAVTGMRGGAGSSTTYNEGSGGGGGSGFASGQGGRAGNSAASTAGGGGGGGRSWVHPSAVGAPVFSDGVRSGDGYVTITPIDRNPPIILGLGADQGPRAGGEIIEVAGVHLLGATQATMGEGCIIGGVCLGQSAEILDCASYEGSRPDSVDICRLEVPPGTGGSVEVTISTPYGTDSRCCYLYSDELAVVEQPQSVSAHVGETVTFTARAVGAPAPNVIWQRQPAGSISWSSIPGATSSTYQHVVTASDDGAKVRAMFVNEASTIFTQEATITVLSTPPSVTSHPEDVAGVAGAVVSFTAAASGHPTPSVAWERAAAGSDEFTPIAGATSATYQRTMNADDDGSRYRAVFTSTAGTATTDPALFSLQMPPLITSGQTFLAERDVPSGIELTAVGVPTPSLSLTGDLPGGMSFLDEGGGRARIQGTPTAGSEGTYNLVLTATNDVGSDSRNIEVIVTCTVAAVADEVTASEPGRATFTTAELMGNDKVCDEETELLVVDDPANGTLTLGTDGSITYEAVAGFAGTDSFTYVLQDSFVGGVRPSATSQPVTVTIVVPEAAGEVPDGVPPGDPSDGPPTGDPDSPVLPGPVGPETPQPSTPEPVVPPVVTAPGSVGADGDASAGAQRLPRTGADTALIVELAALLLALGAAAHTGRRVLGARRQRP